jgi:hypothetical protein
MAATTGPVLALGGITLINESVFHNQPFNWKIPIATGVLAGGMALVEKASPELATGLVWIALAVVLLTRVNPAVPSPTESFVAWWGTTNTAK